jgi:hypothetical protein
VAIPVAGTASPKFLGSMPVKLTPQELRTTEGIHGAGLRGGRVRTSPAARH